MCEGVLMFAVAAGFYGSACAPSVHQTILSARAIVQGLNFSPRPAGPKCAA